MLWSMIGLHLYPGVIHDIALISWVMGHVVMGWAVTRWRAMVVHRHTHLRMVMWVVTSLVVPLALTHLGAGLLGDHDLFHLLDGHGTLHIDPLVGDDVFLLQLEDEVHTADVSVGDEAETAWLIRPLVLQNHRVFDLPKVSEVVLESGQLEVVGETADEDFAELGIDHFTVRKGLLSNSAQSF